MSDSRRQLLVDAVRTRFATILVSGGYETNIGAKLFEWRVTELETADLPALNFRDTRNVTEQKLSHIHQHALEFEADVLTAGVSETPKQIRKMIADVVKCIGVDRTWGGIAYDTDPKEDVLGMDQAGLIAGGARIKFVIKYRTRSFNPYSPQ